MRLKLAVFKLLQPHRLIPYLVLPSFLVLIGFYNNCGGFSSKLRVLNSSSLESGPNPRSQSLYSEQPTNTQIKWTGYYYPQSEVQSEHLDLLDEVNNSSNLITLLYVEGKTGQIHADSLRANNQYAVLYLDIVIGSTQQYVLTNENGKRIEYLNKIKKAISEDSNLIERVRFISPGEEMYARLIAGHFNSFPVFQNLNQTQKILKMKELLEETIADFKLIFPGIPVLHVENRNDENHPPPSNLDVIGLDAYYIPLTTECNSSEREKFYQETIRLLDESLSYGKPVILVPGTFLTAGWSMPSPCQIKWYYDLARFTPGVIGLQYFLYGNYVHPVSKETLVKGLSDPSFEAQKDTVSKFNQELLNKRTPSSITLPLEVQKIIPDLKIQCVATGNEDRFITYTHSNSYTCEQACQAIACATRARCVTAWSVGSEATSENQSSYCSQISPPASGQLIGKVCCCTNSGCSQPTGIMGAL